MNRLAVAWVLALLLTAPAEAATYYVDQTAGNDNNVGSQASPWQDAPGMPGYTGSGTLVAGDIVNFDKGDTWTVSGGNQGLWLVGGVSYYGDAAYGTGTRATIRATSTFPGGLIRFRDHATLQTLFKGFDVDANGLPVTGIDINHGFFSLMTGAIKRVENNIVHGVFSQQSLGEFNYGIIVSNHGGTDGYAENVEIIGNVVHDVSRDGICLYPGDENADTRIRNITVRGNEVYDTGTDPAYCCGAGILIKGYIVDAFIEYNYAHDVDGATVFINGNETNPGLGPSNIHVRHNILTNDNLNGAIRLFDGTAAGDPKDVKVYGNLVYNSTTNGGLLLDTDLDNNLTLLVFNNTFFNAPVIINNISSANILALEMRNNIFHYAAGVPLSDAIGSITAHTNNIYFRGSSTIVSSNGTAYTAATLSTYEASGLSSNPSLVNTADLPTGFTGTYGSTLAPNTTGLNVQAGSPALNSGVTLSSPYTSSVNSVTRPSGAAFDRGAYELNETVPPTGPFRLRFRAAAALFSEGVTCEADV